MAAPSVNGTVGAGDQTPATTADLTYSHTVNAGVSNSYLLVFFCMWGNAIGTPSATYAGTAMSLLVSGTTNEGTAVFGLAAPASGANNVVITHANSRTSSFAVTLQDAKQTGQPDASARAGSAANPASLTVNITTNTNDSLLVDGFFQNDGTRGTFPPTYGANQTSIKEVAGPDADKAYSGSTKTVATAAATSMSRSWASAPGAADGIIVSVAPLAAAAVSPSGMLLLMGVG